MMVKKDVTVKSVSGLHARPGSNLVELSLTFNSDIKLIHNGNNINAKEILEVMMGNINCGDKLTVLVEGDDEQEALDAVCKYIEKGEE
jgi:HPr-like protein crh